MALRKLSSHGNQVFSTIDSLSRSLAAKSNNEVELPIFLLDVLKEKLDELKTTKVTEKSKRKIEGKVAQLGTDFCKSIRQKGKKMGKDFEKPEFKRYAKNATEEDPKYHRELEEIHAWSNMPGKCKQRSPITHLQELRKPHKYRPWYTNRSDTFDRFLYRSANLKVNATIQKWREIHCQNRCCRDKEEKKKMKDATEDEEVEHLQNQLDALMERVLSWSGGPNKTKLVEKVMDPIRKEMEWRSEQDALAEFFNEGLGRDLVQQMMDARMEDYGLRLSDLPELEKALFEAEREEAARIEDQEAIEAEKKEIAGIEEQERLEREKVVAVEEEDENEKEDGSDDDFLHLYADIPTPLLTPIDSISVCEQELTISRPMSLYQRENGPLTPPGTPPNGCTTPEPATEDEFLLDLIDGIIDDLAEEREFWTEKTGNTFHPDVLDPPIDDEPYNVCAWKLHPISNLIADFPPLASQKYPGLRLTNPEGHVFTLEERLPNLGQQFKRMLVEGQQFGMATEELLRRGCNFEQISQWDALDELWASGWKPKKDDAGPDDSDEEEERFKRPINRREHRQEFDIQDTVTPSAAFTDNELEGVFNQEITYLEPGQKFDISTQDLTNNDTNKDPEMALINALLDDTHERREFFQEKWAENLHAARKRACPPPTQLSQNGHCSWKQHPLTDALSPSTQIPEIIVTDSEGNIYTLEEFAAPLDEYSALQIRKRNAWQSQKEIDLGEKGETDEEYTARLRHLADWDMEFRKIDDFWARKEREERGKLRKEEIVKAKDAVDERETAELDSKVDEILKSTDEVDERETAELDSKVDEISKSTDEVDERDATKPDSKMKLAKARLEIEYFDRCFQESLWSVKNEFVEKYRMVSKREGEARKWVEKEERAEEKMKEYHETEDDFRETLQSLEQKLKREVMVTTDENGTTYVGALGEEVYWVEIKGPLAKTWQMLQVVR